MSKANELEQTMLDLVNAERAAVGVDPLVFNGLLNDASEDHSSWMLNENEFSHTGVDGSSPHERIIEAGYKFEGNYSSGENIAFQSERGEEGLEDDVASLHQGLMDSPGHRANILNPNFTEIGIGIERGDFTSGGSEFDSVMATQNFATSDAENSSPDDEDPAVTPTPVPEEVPVDMAGDDEEAPEVETPAEEVPVDMAGDDEEASEEEVPVEEVVEEVPVDLAGDDEEASEEEVPVEEVVEEVPVDLAGDDEEASEEEVPVEEVVEEVPVDMVGDDEEASEEEIPVEEVVEEVPVDLAGGDEGDETPITETDNDGDTYIINIGELNFDFDCSDDMVIDTVADADMDAGDGDNEDTVEATADADTVDHSDEGEFDMALFTEQLTDLMGDFFGDLCNCNEVA